jgi:hypothetical protein
MRQTRLQTIKVNASDRDKTTAPHAGRTAAAGKRQTAAVKRQTAT